MNNSNTLKIMGGFLLSILTGYHAQAQHDPKPVFQGKTGTTVADTREWWQPGKHAPAHAPNVIWILLDDVGFGTTTGFGGLISTPVLDSLGSHGLRYTNFHNTGVCAPTRAAMLTGRNSHAVGFGYFAEAAIGTPGYNGRLPFEAGTIAEVLKENGYNTFAVGKWHLIPPGEGTQAGPFNRWPLGRGFEHYFGFLTGATDQWHPQLWEGNDKIDLAPDNKHLTELLADKAINYIANQRSSAPDKPFFLYFAPGATHSPHQAPEEWIDKYKGKFDAGWDKYREDVYKRQLAAGVIPANTKLPPRSEEVQAWDSLTADQQKLYSRFREVYAGYLSHTDYEIGRIINYLKETGQLDNTLIIAVLGDNGGTKRGSINGITEERAYEPRNQEEIDKEVPSLLSQYNKLGTAQSYAVYPQGWGQADNTPFRYWKYDANSEGATHTPLVIFYPEGIKERGIRNQYGHIIDLLPTTVALTGAKIPDVINGYKQEPVQGISLAYSVKDATAASRHTLQYYEITGNRAIYKDGWKATAYHQDGKGFNEDTWNLYHLSEDWSESNDLAAKEPAKLAALKKAFDEEARKYNVYPLKGRSYQPKKKTGKSVTVLYPGITQLNEYGKPNLSKGSFSVTAETTIPDTGAEGVLFADGGKDGGISLFIKDGKLQLLQTNGQVTASLVADRPVSAGSNTFKVAFIPDKAHPKAGGDLSLYIGHTQVAQQYLKVNPLERAVYNALDEGIDVGRDGITAVGDAYAVPYQFTGTIHKVIIETEK
ncbi:arylsulfatase [Chitinophaga sp. MM2321]|uniref:arylsulfatase n=1 Tax=Chitinophaga sp. MM2321 TaxID=3137178 RepID=UPI0032D5AA85